MEVCVVGLGYVGLVSAACMARDGNRVVGVEVSKEKVQQINSGICPIVEPELPELLRDCFRKNRNHEHGGGY